VTAKDQATSDPDYIKSPQPICQRVGQGRAKRRSSVGAGPFNSQAIRADGRWFTSLRRFHPEWLESELVGHVKGASAELEATVQGLYFERQKAERVPTRFRKCAQFASQAVAGVPVIQERQVRTGWLEPKISHPMPAPRGVTELKVDEPEKRFSSRYFFRNERGQYSRSALRVSAKKT